MNAIVVDSKQYGHSKDELILFLKEHGVDTRLLFTGMHRQKALLDVGCNSSGQYPVSDWLTENGLYLPSASNLTEEKIHFICKLISKFVG